MKLDRPRLQLTVETIRTLVSSTNGAVDQLARTNRCGVSYRKC